MRYFSIEYEWKTRPMFRKGTFKTRKLAFAANDQTEAYRLAQEEGKMRFPRHQWKIIGCTELTVPPRMENHERSRAADDRGASAGNAGPVAPDFDLVATKRRSEFEKS